MAIKKLTNIILVGLFVLILSAPAFAEAGIFTEAAVKGISDFVVSQILDEKDGVAPTEEARAKYNKYQDLVVEIKGDLSVLNASDKETLKQIEEALALIADRFAVAENPA